MGAHDPLARTLQFSWGDVNELWHEAARGPNSLDVRPKKLVVVVFVVVAMVVVVVVVVVVVIVVVVVVIVGGAVGLSVSQGHLTENLPRLRLPCK